MENLMRSDEGAESRRRPRRLRALAAWVDEVSSSTAISYATAHFGASKVFTVAAVNPEKCRLAEANGEIAEFLASSDLLLPDGIGVVILCRLLGAREIQRVAGCDFALELVAAAAAKGGGVFLVGASEASSIRAGAFLVTRFGESVLAGRINGYEDLDNNCESIVSTIKDSGALVVLVALGSPRQEQWIERVRVKLSAGVIMGVGGTFDVWSGSVPRAPEMFQRMGLEWLFRLLREPTRVVRQSRLVVFAAKALREVFFARWRNRLF